MPRGSKRKFEEVTTFYTVDERELDQATSLATVETLSASGRHVIRHEHPVYTPPSPPRLTTWTRPQPVPADFLYDTEPTEPEENVETAIPGSKQNKNERFLSTEHDSFLNEWTRLRDFFLNEFLWLEGPRNANMACAHCKRGDDNDGVYRCKDCVGEQLLCKRCCVKSHKHNPFHHIEFWNGHFFELTSLKNIGFILQLGHSSGSCKNPVAGPCDFVVIHTNGLHEVAVQFCMCENVQVAGNRLQQLLRLELYPATISMPSTCATFRALDHYHLLTLQSKIPGYDYYLSLEYLSNNAGLGPRHNRLKSFMRMVREWRHLKMLKRASRGHEAGGVAGTRTGELCMLCPACPQPGVNLPENWDDIPEDKKYIYNLFIAMDANFRLKCRAVSSNERDPALGSGWGYFVEDTAYCNMMLAYADQEEISTCTGFAAIEKANTKFSKGYAVTGIGMAVCARHGFILPNAAGDLQKGERYVNMDYIILSTLKFIIRHGQSISAFKSRNIWRGCKSKIPDGMKFVIPKYHFRAHKEKDHNKYSLNYVPGSGRVCGEQPECNWPKHEETAASTREMGPGSRHDTLEDHFAYANWCVYMSIGSLLHHQLKDAIKECAIQEDIYQGFEERLSPENVKAWTDEVVEFERDNSLPDPYYREPTGLTEADARLQLAEEDEKATHSGSLSLHQVTPAAMIVELLEIEEAQRRFKQKYPRAATHHTQNTAAQNTEVAEKRSMLRRRLTNIREVQAIYMPCILQLLARYLQDHGTQAQLQAQSSPMCPPEDEPLFLPYQLNLRELEGCIGDLASVEERVRNAQLYDALDKLRVHLHIKSRLVYFKNRQVRHQGPNTHARRKIDVNESKIVQYANKYRAARIAKLKLTGPGEWERQWKVLDRKDIRTMTIEDALMYLDEKGKMQVIPEGPREPSWIWMAADKEEVDGAVEEGMQDALCIEFLRARARAQRYREHINILREEQRRVLVTLEYNTQIWGRREREALESDAGDEYAMGRAAYAAEQADATSAQAEKADTGDEEPQQPLYVDMYDSDMEEDDEAEEENN
ncbi:hypothetical protein NM688_g7034 [Phlebia brevispora]|uniref:Uncharacterized protein n=1 Tax=Phlebia brevispora TaxID=194682 RepID=A0ACC1S9R8_9APHY|nr:hypothetical protein NM688_g7034 [Phlebia brevispora]